MVRKKRVPKDEQGVVQERLLRLGAHVRLARVRRGLTIKQAGEKIGAGVRAVRDAELGKRGSAIWVTVSLLELYGLADDLERLADPARDAEGLRLGGPTLRQHARRTRAEPSVAPPLPAPPPRRPDVALPDAVRHLLSPTELAALAFLQIQTSAKIMELAGIVGLAPNRLTGMMRELRRKLVEVGQRDFLLITNLPDGDVLFTVEKRRSAEPAAATSARRGVLPK